jgi:N-acetyl-anhydromuramyl-L-alanine amidase AmpD
MRREINELVVMPVYVADDVNGNDFEAVRAQLQRENMGDSGLHFLVMRDGTPKADRMVQRIAEALTYHNTESIVVGYVAGTDSDGSEAQWATIEALLTALHATFPKATLTDVERWNRHTANIRDPQESRWAKVFE